MKIRRNVIEQRYEPKLPRWLRRGKGDLGRLSER